MRRFFLALFLTLTVTPFALASSNKHPDTGSEEDVWMRQHAEFFNTFHAKSEDETQEVLFDCLRKVFDDREACLRKFLARRGTHRIPQVLLVRNIKITLAFINQKDNIELLVDLNEIDLFKQKLKETFSQHQANKYDFLPSIMNFVETVCVEEYVNKSFFEKNTVAKSAKDFETLDIVNAYEKMKPWADQANQVIRSFLQTSLLTLCPHLSESTKSPLDLSMRALQAIHFEFSSGYDLAIKNMMEIDDEFPNLLARYLYDRAFFFTNLALEIDPNYGPKTDSKYQPGSLLQSSIYGDVSSVGSKKALEPVQVQEKPEVRIIRIDSSVREPSRQRLRLRQKAAELEKAKAPVVTKVQPTPPTPSAPPAELSITQPSINFPHVMSFLPILQNCADGDVIDVDVLIKDIHEMMVRYMMIKQDLVEAVLAQEGTQIIFNNEADALFVFKCKDIMGPDTLSSEMSSYAGAINATENTPDVDTFISRLSKSREALKLGYDQNKLTQKSLLSLRERLFADIFAMKLMTELAPQVLAKKNYKFPEAVSLKMALNTYKEAYEDFIKCYQDILLEDLEGKKNKNSVFRILNNMVDCRSAEVLISPIDLLFDNGNAAEQNSNYMKFLLMSTDLLKQVVSVDFPSLYDPRSEMRYHRFAPETGLEPLLCTMATFDELKREYSHDHVKKLSLQKELSQKFVAKLAEEKDAAVKQAVALKVSQEQLAQLRKENEALKNSVQNQKAELRTLSKKTKALTQKDETEKAEIARNLQLVPELKASNTSLTDLNHNLSEQNRTLEKQLSQTKKAHEVLQAATKDYESKRVALKQGYDERMATIRKEKQALKAENHKLVVLLQDAQDETAKVRAQLESEKAESDGIISASANEIRILMAKQRTAEAELEALKVSAGQQPVVDAKLTKKIAKLKEQVLDRNRTLKLLEGTLELATKRVKELETERARMFADPFTYVGGTYQFTGPQGELFNLSVQEIFSLVGNTVAGGYFNASVGHGNAPVGSPVEEK